MKLNPSPKFKISYDTKKPINELENFIVDSISYDLRINEIILKNRNGDQKQILNTLNVDYEKPLHITDTTSRFIFTISFLSPNIINMLLGQVIYFTFDNQLFISTIIQIDLSKTYNNNNIYIYTIKLDAVKVPF